ncbi:energy transducer TonB [Psychroserpens sp. S379A]|uniref:energy transducer TonB n=1 Tax=Psychroserpens sp. S379A TaxID=3415137 RepID=UPI003C797FF1
MKKQTLLTLAAIITLTLAAFGSFSWNTTTPVSTTNHLTALEHDQNMVTKTFKAFPDFIYDIGPRFSGIKKSEIKTYTSIADFLDEDTYKNIDKVHTTSLILVVNDRQTTTRANGTSGTFNKAQLKFLQTATYATNFVMRVDYDEKDPQSGYTFDSYRSPHHTIVPEEQAYYSDGKEQLKLFLKESCQSVLIDVDPEKLKPAKLYFTVTKHGTIENINLDRDSGYPDVDKKMIELINNTPGTWQPAKNSKGEAVNQELVISFGLMGC